MRTDLLITQTLVYFNNFLEEEFLPVRLDFITIPQN